MYPLNVMESLDKHYGRERAQASLVLLHVTDIGVTGKKYKDNRINQGNFKGVSHKVPERLAFISDRSNQEAAKFLIITTFDTGPGRPV